MRRLIPMLLILSLLLSLPAALAESGETTVIAFPELPFTTLADFDCVTRVKEDRMLFVYTEEPGDLPFLYIKLDDGENRVTDAESFINDMENISIRDEDFKLAGRPMANVEEEFMLNSDQKVYGVTAVDVRENYTGFYGAYYTDPDMKPFMLDALETLVANLRYTGGSAATAADSNPVPYICAEQRYTTLADPAWRMEWVDGDGTYYHFTDLNVPYVLAWVDTDNDRITDGMAALENYMPELQESYQKNGAVSTSLHGSFTVAGKPVAAADVQYRNSDGARIYLLVVVDVQGDYTATYHVRYMEEDGRQQALDALDLIAGNLRLTVQGEAAQTNATQPQTEAPRTGQTDTATGVYSLDITSLRETENGFGRCVAPGNYEVRWNHTRCTTNNSISFPHRLSITAECPEQGITMLYFSATDYLSSIDGSTETDGQFDMDWFTPRLHYMNASDYCDYLVLTAVPELAGSLKVVSEDALPEAQRALERLAKASLAEQNPSGSDLLGIYHVEGGEYTICQKRYSCVYEGTPHDVMVLTACISTRITTSYVGWTVQGNRIGFGTVETGAINWEVPFTYILICPSAYWDEGSTAFEQFTANTRASDQFDEANKKLAVALWNVVKKSRGLNSCESYSERTLREETENGEDYDLDRITDYIFDQNDYTLSDGNHVKVDNSYDYVYEGDNGTVYYSNSAFAQPGGSTQLYPNR